MYRALYQAVNACGLSFVTVPHENIDFKSGIIMVCVACHKAHNFAFKTSYNVTTPTEIKNFEQMVKNGSWVKDVEA